MINNNIIKEGTNIKKYSYRIKTEKEFLEEYGENWRSKYSFAFIDPMDHLLGKDLNIKDYVDYLNKDGRLELSDSDNISISDYIFDPNGETWYIHGYMIKEIRNTPDYNTPRQLVYENKILKYNDFIK